MTSKFNIIETINLCKKNNRDAQSALYQKYSFDLYKYLHFLCGKKELAEDLVQNTFIKVFRNIGSLKNNEGIKGWIFQIARNLYFDHLKSANNSKRDNNEINFDQIEDESNQSESVLELKNLLNQLDAKDRDLIILVEISGNSLLEVSEITGISLSAVKSRLHRVRKTLNNINK